jgi:hypothetical protein
MSAMRGDADGKREYTFLVPSKDDGMRRYRAQVEPYEMNEVEETERRRWRGTSFGPKVLTLDVDLVLFPHIFALNQRRLVC